MSSTAASRTRRRRCSAPDHDELIWLPEEAFAAAFAQRASMQSRPCWPLCNGRSHLAASAFRSSDGTFREPPVSPWTRQKGAMPDEGLDPSTQKWSASLDEIRTALTQPGQSDERTWLDWRLSSIPRQHIK